MYGWWKMDTMCFPNVYTVYIGWFCINYMIIYAIAEKKAQLKLLCLSLFVINRQYNFSKSLFIYLFCSAVVVVVVVDRIHMIHRLTREITGPNCSVLRMYHVPPPYKCLFSFFFFSFIKIYVEHFFRSSFLFRCSPVNRQVWNNRLRTIVNYFGKQGMPNKFYGEEIIPSDFTKKKNRKQRKHFLFQIWK